MSTTNRPCSSIDHFDAAPAMFRPHFFQRPIDELSSLRISSHQQAIFAYKRIVGLILLSFNVIFNTFDIYQKQDVPIFQLYSCWIMSCHSISFNALVTLILTVKFLIN